MNSHYPKLDVAAGSDILMSPRPTGTKRMSADWLGLAASPTFATMALVAAILGGGSPDVLCSSAQDALPLTGMVPMYLLMTAFHSAPWLKLISNRQSGARGS